MAKKVARRQYELFAFGRKLEYEVELFDDPLDALLKINCDSLINMVLHYLSCIPI